MARPIVFVSLVAGVLVLSVGHLYAISGMTDVYLGVPAWLWAHLGVLAVLLGMAWVAIEYGLAEGR